MQVALDFSFSDRLKVPSSSKSSANPSYPRTKPSEDLADAGEAPSPSVRTAAAVSTATALFL